MERWHVSAPSCAGVRERRADRRSSTFGVVRDLPRTAVVLYDHDPDAVPADWHAGFAHMHIDRDGEASFDALFGLVFAWQASIFGDPTVQPSEQNVVRIQTRACRQLQQAHT